MTSVSLLVVRREVGGVRTCIGEPSVCTKMKKYTRWRRTAVRHMHVELDITVDRRETRDVRAREPLKHEHINSQL